MRWLWTFFLALPAALVATAILGLAWVVVPWPVWAGAAAVALLGLVGPLVFLRPSIYWALRLQPCPACTARWNTMKFKADVRKGQQRGALTHQCRRCGAIWTTAANENPNDWLLTPPSREEQASQLPGPGFGSSLSS